MSDERQRRRNFLIGKLQAFRASGKHHDTAAGQRELESVLAAIDELAADTAAAERDRLLLKFDGYVPADVVSSLRWRVRELEAQLETRQEGTPK